MKARECNIVRVQCEHACMRHCGPTLVEAVHHHIAEVPGCRGRACCAGQLFNWHPLCMVVAFPVLMAEALLAYRAPYTAQLQK